MPTAASPTTWSTSIFVATLAAGAAPRLLDGVAAIEWHDPLALDPGRLAFASMTWALATYPAAAPVAPWLRHSIARCGPPSTRR